MREPPLLSSSQRGTPTADEYGWSPTPHGNPHCSLCSQRGTPRPLPQSLNEIEGATNPACGTRRNRRVTAVTVLDFFRPLRFPRFASSSPRREPPTLSSSRRGTPLKAQSSSTPLSPPTDQISEGARIKNSEGRRRHLTLNS